MSTYKLPAIGQYILFVPLQLAALLSMIFFAFSSSTIVGSSSWPLIVLFSLVSTIGFAGLHFSYLNRLAYVSRHLGNHQNAQINKSPYAFLLRSFSNSDTYMTTKQVILPDGGPASVGYETESFISDIDVALRKNEIVLVALSNHLDLPSDHGVLVIECPDALWMEDFQILSSNAKAIILVPEITSGITREIEFIMNNGLLSKTIFIMPPLLENNQGKNYFSAKTQMLGESRDQRWKYVRDVFRNRGIFMPSYNQDGELFILKEGKDVALATMSLDHESAADSFFHAFAHLFPYLGNTGIPVNEMYSIVKPYKKHKTYKRIGEEAPGSSVPFVGLCVTLIIIAHMSFVLLLSDNLAVTIFNIRDLWVSGWVSGLLMWAGGFLTLLTIVSPILALWVSLLVFGHRNLMRRIYSYVAKPRR